MAKGEKIVKTDAIVRKWMLGDKVFNSYAEAVQWRKDNYQNSIVQDLADIVTTSIALEIPGDGLNAASLFADITAKFNVTRKRHPK